jgi:ABC-type phosphate/phosphonate transport system ATPase subunit
VIGIGGGRIVLDEASERLSDDALRSVYGRPFAVTGGAAK